LALIPGTRLGVYEITAQIGEGGMGQVYRATDTKLKRQVAIKILPPAAVDSDRLARFQREAEVLASLNHPHIAAIYGLEESGGVSALVMELVDGESLDRRIARGPIPVDESLAIARQITEALEAAHEKGIIHRDLKPANIMLTHDGTVKVLDFGLAKSTDANRGAVDLANSPTITSPPMMTDIGVILGTAAYMSPEQARGRSADRRADIWAFGCVLFEMLTGRAAFPADTLSDTIAAVLTREPDWNLVPTPVRPAIRRVLRKCLEKDPRQRLRDIGDVRMELDEALVAPSSAGPADTGAIAAPVRFTWSTRIGAAVLLVALGATLQYWRVPPVAADAVRLSLSVPGQFFTQPPSVVMSPDGRQLAFVSADSSGKLMLWIRALDSQGARVLPGTERADEPFWSPDGRLVGFFADGQLKTIAAAGGPVQVLATAPVSPGATWNQDGTILFAQAGSGLRKVSAAGGVVSPVLLSHPGGGISWPHFLPDGRHFLYFGRSAQHSPGVYVGSLDTNDTKLILTSEFEATYAPPGYLLFVRDETLMAQGFDAKRLEVTGEPAVVASGAWVARGYGHGVFSAGANGALTYVNADIASTQLAWFDRSGRPLGTYGPPSRYDSPPQLSPNSPGIAVTRGPFFRQDLWLLDPVRETDSRFTFDRAGSRVPVWFRDGSRILFQSARDDGRVKLYQKSASGAGGEERLADIADVNLQDVSPDGRFVVYMIVGKEGRFELWVLPLFGDHRPFPFLQTEFNNGQAQVSPDGRWIAYTSNEAGRDEVYVQSFPTTGSKHQISREGGAQPRWRRNGGELFYLAPDRVLMAVPVKAGAPLQIGRPTALFRTRLEYLGLQGPFFMAGYDVTADGQRFLLNAAPEQVVVPIDVLLNWTAVLNKKR
jgi:Tol biopolymer transport system component